MKKILTKGLTVIVVVIAILGYSSTSNANTFKTLPLEGVKKLSINGNVEVIVLQAENESLNIYYSAAQDSAIMSKVGDKLSISSNSIERLQVVVTMVELSSIETHGDAVVRSLNTILSNELTIVQKDKSIVDLTLDVSEVNTIINECSTLRLSGRANRQNIVVNGSSIFDATEFKLDNNYHLSRRAKLFVNRGGERVIVRNTFRTLRNS
ncbi:GIN domain-containing protein [Paradesertivirga mongoliensis]|uniref:GIN domain-containing protein n=1 Tax=Paradesertivirga mongoliensis TaxID=2100740 RepID=A0ABW4ZRR4_9SPHI|nr:DUF2807 domain-containing protein [Pedobacter mongoliensis]